MMTYTDSGSTAPLRSALKLGRAAWMLLLAAVLLYGIGSSAYVLAFAATGERWPWIALANNFLPWWALGGLGAAIVALLSHWRWSLVALQLPVIVAFTLLYGDLLLPPDAAATPAGPHFRTATFNILGSRSDPATIAATIRDLDADIIGLQEVTPAHSAMFERDLIDSYPYQVHYPQLPVHGVALLSRYPIRSAEVVRPLPDSMLYLRAELDVVGVPLVVYVAHPPPPRALRDDTPYDSTRRDQEIAILLDEYLAQERGPVVVLGDFNMVDLSAAYDLMAARFDDAFRSSGQGLGFTFPANRTFGVLPSMLRIDYIWYNADLAALAARAGDDGGTSDHLPVIADLAFNKRTAAK